LRAGAAVDAVALEAPPGVNAAARIFTRTEDVVE
jgi:hypothetical protein